MSIIQAFVIVFLPALMVWLAKKLKIESWLSPVVLCYGMGILIGNIHLFPEGKELATSATEITVLLAIPLLLYATNLLKWFKHAKSTIGSFALCLFAGLISSILGAWLFLGLSDEVWIMSGMLVGMYTGGTPNMATISMALDASENLFILLNASDIFCGGIYLLFLTSIAKKTLSLFLRPFKAPETTTDNAPVEATEPSSTFYDLSLGMKLWSLLKGFGLTIVVVGSAVGLTFLLTGGLKAVGLIILLLTSFSIAFSFIDKVRKLPGTYEAGEYLLLMFCVAAGMLADFGTLINESGMALIFTATVMSSTIILHFLLARLFRLDVDTVIITSTAAIYGPAFIGQVASAIRNKELIFSGIAAGLVGIALGNYLGLGIAWFVRYLFF